MTEKQATNNEGKVNNLLKYSLLSGGIGSMLGVSRAISKKKSIPQTAAIAGVNFFLAASIFFGIKEGAEYLRKKNDVYNYLISGAFIGAGISLSIPSNSAKLVAIASFTTLGGIVYGTPFLLKTIGNSIEVTSPLPINQTTITLENDNFVYFESHNKFLDVREGIDF